MKLICPTAKYRRALLALIEEATEAERLAVRVVGQRCFPAPDRRVASPAVYAPWIAAAKRMANVMTECFEENVEDDVFLEVTDETAATLVAGCNWMRARTQNYERASDDWSADFGDAPGTRACLDYALEDLTAALSTWPEEYLINLPY